MARIQCLAIVTGLAYAIQAASTYASPPSIGEPLGPLWSTRAIVEAPQILQTVITRDGTMALYIVRVNNIEADKRESHLYKISLETGERKEILHAGWISDIAAIPGTDDWSLCSDLGEGVQLYRLSAEGKIAPIVIRTQTVVIGQDHTVAIANPIIESDQAFGVLGYGWSDDGKFLWYSTAHVVPAASPRMEILDNPLVPLDIYVPNVSELHVVDLRGNDRIIASARGQVTPYPTIVYASGAAHWTSDLKESPSLVYSLETIQPNGSRLLISERYNTIAGSSWPVASQDIERNPSSQRTGAHGGTLKIVGPMGTQHLVEELKSGVKIDLGKAALSLGWWTSRGDWHFAHEGASVHGVRITGVKLRNSIIKITADNRLLYLEPALSLSNCSFSETAARGVCIREGISHPPELVSVDVKSWSVKAIGPVDSRYQAIQPLRNEPKIWKAGSLEATGFLLYPRNYNPSRRYPAIILTHGYDADNTFARKDFQWSYPAQVWAERGYVVIAVNDIVFPQGSERAKAYDQWATSAGDLSPAELYDLIWRDNVKTYEAVVASLSETGVIDPERVGIAGFSRGSQMTEIAVSQTHLFKAASSGDGGMFAPSSYWSEGVNSTYKMLFGGAPFDPLSAANWRELSPTARADKVQTPVLFQIAKTLNMRVDFYHALRDQAVPAEFAFWPTETHQFHSPVNQLAAMEQNLDWFDFWLRGVEDPDPAKATQYTRWREMRNQQPRMH